MITERTNAEGMTFLDIDTDHCKATVSLHGAQVMSWIPRGHEECLFTSSKAAYAPGSPIRGGIPLCWPWFGKRDGSPSHGFARTHLWEINHHGIDPDDGVASIHLRLYSKEDHLPMAVLRITLANELRMRLQTTSRKAECSLTAAFHNYLRVKDVSKCRIVGLGSIPYVQDGVQYKPKHSPLAPMAIQERTVRIYSAARPLSTVSLDDPGLQRRITINTENTRSMVVWNPWKEGTKDIHDLGPDEWRQFICIEPANTEPEPVKLSLGQTHIMRQTIKVQPLL